MFKTSQKMQAHHLLGFEPLIQQMHRPSLHQYGTTLLEPQIKSM